MTSGHYANFTGVTYSKLLKMIIIMIMSISEYTSDFRLSLLLDLPYRKKCGVGLQEMANKTNTVCQKVAQGELGYFRRPKLAYMQYKQQQRPLQSSLASNTKCASGILIFLCLIIADLTYQFRCPPASPADPLYRAVSGPHCHATSSTLLSRIQN